MPLLLFLIGWRWWRGKHDPNHAKAKQGAAHGALKAAGLDRFARDLRPAGNGICFTVDLADRAEFLARLTARGWRNGSLYWFHADQADCRNFGECRDYRTDNGVIGPGSLQIVYNHATGAGFVDYDQWNPYQSVWHWAKHAEEI